MDPEDRVRALLPSLASADSASESEVLREQLAAPSVRVDPEITGWADLTPAPGSRPAGTTQNPRTTYFYRSGEVIGSMLLWFNDEGYVSALEWLSYTDDDGFPNSADLDGPS